MPSQTPPSLFRRVLRRSILLSTTAIFVAGAVGLTIFGQSILAERAAAVSPPEATNPIPVAIAALRFEDGYEVTRRFTGQIEAAQETRVSFEQGGTIATILVEEGERVMAGDLIATLDTRLLNADRARLAATRRALEAQEELARRTTDRQSALQERGFASSQALDTASLGLAELEARIAEVDASLVALEIQLEKAQIRAPFDGEISERALDEGSIAGAGQAVVTLVERSTPRFRVGLSSELVEGLDAAAAEVEIAGQTLPVTLESVLPDIDPATRTRTALFRLAASGGAFGETGTLVLDQRLDDPGAWVPLSALQNGPRGLWRLMTVKDGIVGTEAVEILFADAERAFVRGTMIDGITFITEGVHRIVPGQTVMAEGI